MISSGVIGCKSHFNNALNDMFVVNPIDYEAENTRSQEATAGDLQTARTKASSGQK